MLGDTPDGFAVLIGQDHVVLENDIPAFGNFAGEDSFQPQDLNNKFS